MIQLLEWLLVNILVVLATVWSAAMIVYGFRGLHTVIEYRRSRIRRTMTLAAVLERYGRRVESKKQRSAYTSEKRT